MVITRIYFINILNKFNCSNRISINQNSIFVIYIDKRYLIVGYIKIR